MSTPTHLMKQTVTLQRPTRTPNLSGVPGRSFAAVKTGVPASIQMTSATEAAALGHVDGRVVYNCFMPFTYDGTDVTLRTKDQLVDADSVVYEVLGPGEDESGEGRLQKAIIEKATTQNSGDF